MIVTARNNTPRAHRKQLIAAVNHDQVEVYWRGPHGSVDIEVSGDDVDVAVHLTEAEARSLYAGLRSFYGERP